MNKQERLKAELHKHGLAMKKAKSLMDRKIDKEHEQKILDLVERLCKKYLQDLMNGCNTFYHTSDHFGSKILMEYFGEDFYKWTDSLADSRD